MVESQPDQQQQEAVLVRYRNREIRPSDLAFIESMMAANPGMGRTPLSRLLCSAWNWRQPGGGLKEYACRDLLLRLEEWGHIKLPPRINGNGQKKRAAQLELGFEPEPMESGDLSRLVVRPVRDPKERLTWRILMDRYH